MISSISLFQMLCDFSTTYTETILMKLHTNKVHEIEISDSGSVSLVLLFIHLNVA